MHVCVPGDMTISMSIMDEASTPEMKMATASVKSMSIPWKGFGPFCGAGCVPIEAFGIVSEYLFFEEWELTIQRR
jgi:hypothetical protein